MVKIAYRFTSFVVRHWLALVNTLLALLLGLSLLAPVLMLHDQAGLGNLLYLLFRPSCHQLPERSFFLGGPQIAYTLAELTERVGFEVPLRFVGSPQVGYKLAYCQRCAGIYAGWFLAGLAFIAVRRRLKRLPWVALILLALPMAIDGGMQLFGVFESIWQRRLVTGLLFGIGVVWFAFPMIEAGMSNAREDIQRGLEEAYAADR